MKIKYWYPVGTGTQRWTRVPGFAFPRYRHLRNKGEQEGKFYTGTQERGMREHGTRKNRNAKFAYL